MSDEQHLSTDRITDLLDGSLPAAEQMRANAHLATCAACAQVRDDQAFVAALLAADAADSSPMPSDISLRLDLAIERAAHDRATAAVPLDEARRRRSSLPIRWLTGAAAAIVVAGIGIAGWQAVDHNGGSSSSGALAQPTIGPSGQSGDGRNGQSGALHSKGTEPPATAPQIGGPPEQGLPAVTARGVAPLAQRLTAHPARAIPPQKFHCSRPISPGLASAVIWNDHRAVLSLDPDTRIATILDCANAVQSLYQTGY